MVISPAPARAATSPHGTGATPAGGMTTSGEPAVSASGSISRRDHVVDGDVEAFERRRRTLPVGGSHHESAQREHQMVDCDDDGLDRAEPHEPASRRAHDDGAELVVHLHELDERAMPEASAKAATSSRALIDRGSPGRGASPS
ncbi:MAG: hypothetical protein WKF58_15665 [Ilumatobacteraceae bacterium]